MYGGKEHEWNTKLYIVQCYNVWLPLINLNMGRSYGIAHKYTTSGCSVTRYETAHPVVYINRQIYEGNWLGKLIDLL